MSRVIRMALAEDATRVAEIYRPYVLKTAISFESMPPSTAEMGARIASALSFAPWLILVEDHNLLGFAYAGKHRDRSAYQWSVDASVYIDQDAQRRGIGRALYTSLFALLRLQGFFRVHAGITLPNAASVGLHESFGFRPIGVYPAVGYKHARWHDVGWWQLELRERHGEPPPPLSMAELIAASDYDAALRAGLT